MVGCPGAKVVRLRCRSHAGIVDRCPRAVGIDIGAVQSIKLTARCIVHPVRYAAFFFLNHKLQLAKESSRLLRCDNNISPVCPEYVTDLPIWDPRAPPALLATRISQADVERTKTLCLKGVPEPSPVLALRPLPL